MPNKSMSSAKRERDAKTGRFVKKGSEVKRPSRTVVETVKPRKRR